LESSLSIKRVRGIIYGTSDVTLVDSSRFASISRTSTVMSIRLDDPACTNGVCPAILISNPYPTVPGRGLVVFYAFPLDDLIKEGEGGLRLINNLFRFLTC
jgi:hypothetical protein